MMADRQEQASSRRRQPRWCWYMVLTAVVVCASAAHIPRAMAAENQSYKALRDWIDQARTAPPTFTPGQRLTEVDRKVIEPFIPQSVWDY